MKDRSTESRSSTPRDFPRRENPLLNPYVSTALILCVGIFLGGHLLTLVRGRSEEKRKAEFRNTAGELVQSIQGTVDRSILQLEALRSFHLASREVERAEFHDFVQHLLTHDAAIQALEWVPRVPNPLREAYEGKARAEGHPRFQVREKGREGSFVRAGPREEYYPVYYVEPYDGNERALGYDLASDPVRLEALSRARDSGEMAATGRIILVQERQEQYGFLVFQPVYRRGEASLSVEDRRRNLEGFYLLVLRAGSLLQNSLAGLDRRGLSLDVFDDSSSGAGRFLGRLAAGREEASSAPLGEEADLLAGEHFEGDVTVADRRWKVLVTPVPGHPGAPPSWQSWGIPALAFISTFVLAGYVFLILLQARTTKKHVLQIQASKESLEAEAARRYLLEMDLEERVRLAEMLADIGRALSGQDSLEAMLRGCTDALVSNLDAALARIWTIDGGGGILELKASSGLYTHTEGAHSRIAVGDYKIGRIAADRLPHLTNQVLGDPLVHDQEWARRNGLIAFAGHPLLLGDVLVGVLGMFSRRPLNEVVLTSLRSACAEISVGIQRRRAEEMVRKERDRARNYLDIAGVMLIVIGRDKKVSLVNRKGCEILGCEEEEEVRGRNWFQEFVPRRIRGELESGFERMLAGEFEPMEFYENPIVRKDGKERVISWHNTIVRDGEGRITGTLSSGEDVTESRKTAEALRKAHRDLEVQYEELKELDRMKDGLIRDVSHELKTPVAKHAMQLEILKPIISKHRLSDEEAKALLIMEESIRRQESVIRNLLDLSLLESGGRKYRREPLRLDELIGNVLRDYRDAIERYGVDLEVHVPALTIGSDEEMLWHLFSNLVNNALKFRRADAPAMVSVSAGVAGDEVSVRVTDNGIGMSEEEVARSFDRFYQSSASREGSGVGLTICKMIAQGLGGRISLESEGRGRGTTAVVTLPVS